MPLSLLSPESLSATAASATAESAASGSATPAPASSGSVTPGSVTPALPPRRVGSWRLLGLLAGALAFVPLPLSSGAAAAPPLAPAAAARPAPLPAAVSPAPAAAPPATATGAAVPEPMSAAAFAALLKAGDLDQLDAACRLSVAAGDRQRLALLRQRLLTMLPVPQPLPVVLANADVLLSCQQPQAALEVLDRFGPAPGAERTQWLLLQWRAASAALDHQRAALALERLAEGRLPALQEVLLPLRRRSDGTLVSGAALDALAAHLESRGLAAQAAEALLAAERQGPAGAERMQRVVQLLEDLPAAQRAALLDGVLQESAAAGAWGMVSELLDLQISLASDRARERRLRLSPRLDDAYGEWLLRRDDPAQARRLQLERQLRSPRAPGGHAAAGPVVPAPSGSTPAPSVPTVP